MYRREPKMVRFSPWSLYAVPFGSLRLPGPYSYSSKYQVWVTHFGDLCTIPTTGPPTLSKGSLQVFDLLLSGRKDACLTLAIRPLSFTVLCSSSRFALLVIHCVTTLSRRWGTRMVAAGLCFSIVLPEASDTGGRSLCAICLWHRWLWAGWIGPRIQQPIMMFDTVERAVEVWTLCGAADAWDNIIRPSSWHC
jgi:hypothetical protein